MFDTLLQMFSYTFIQRALIVGLLVSICASLLGVNLVLKRYSMIGDGLSHVGFGALAVATAFNWAPLAVSIPVTIVAAFVLLRLTDNGKIKGDAAIALLAAVSMAVGVFVISLSTGMNTDVDNYLFGSILALNSADVVVSVILCIAVLVLFLFFYNRIFALTFDQTFAKASGMRVGVYNTVLAVLVACTIVVGMRMMGALLISSLVIFPALSAMHLCKRFKAVTICAAIVSVGAYLVGLAISMLFATPTGASIVLVNFALFALFWSAEKLRNRYRTTS
jgi:zinc transport system permease protein